MGTSTQLWSTREWQAGAEAWIADRLAAIGRTMTGPIEQTRLRPWSTVLRAPTADGPVWFKASATGTRYEVPLLAALGRWGTTGILPPIAVDVERGWMLLPDAGRPLRDEPRARLPNIA